MSDLHHEKRRKRLIFRASHRGMKEADVLLGGYVTTHAEALDDGQLDRLESLLEELDVDIMDWVMGKRPVPDRHDNDIFARILAYKPYK